MSNVGFIVEYSQKVGLFMNIQRNEKYAPIRESLVPIYFYYSLFALNVNISNIYTCLTHICV